MWRWVWIFHLSTSIFHHYHSIIYSHLVYSPGFCSEDRGVSGHHVPHFTIQTDSWATHWGPLTPMVLRRCQLRSLLLLTDTGVWRDVIGTQKTGGHRQAGLIIGAVHTWLVDAVVTNSLLVRFIINATRLINVWLHVATASMVLMQNKSLEQLSSFSDWFCLQHGDGVCHYYVDNDDD